MNETSFLSWLGHSFSGAAIVGALLGWLPHIAALLAVIWYIVQIWESRTCQAWRAALRHWNRNRIMMARSRKLARLRAKEKVVNAQIEALEKVRLAKADARELVASAEGEAAKLLNRETTEAVAKLPPVG